MKHLGIHFNNGLNILINHVTVEKKSTIAAKRLKNLAGNTQNINESKINLDS